MSERDVDDLYTRNPSPRTKMYEMESSVVAITFSVASGGPESAWTTCVERMSERDVDDLYTRNPSPRTKMYEMESSVVAITFSVASGGPESANSYPVNI